MTWSISTQLDLVEVKTHACHTWLMSLHFKKIRTSDSFDQVRVHWQRVHWQRVRVHCLRVRVTSKAGVVCLQVKLCDPRLSALEVRLSRRGAIQIYFYLYLYLTASLVICSSVIMSLCECCSNSICQVQQVQPFFCCHPWQRNKVELEGVWEWCSPADRTTTSSAPAESTSFALHFVMHFCFCVLNLWRFKIFTLQSAKVIDFQHISFNTLL